ncbi:hypothetical protein BGZ99_010179 [Dissophora globulifera]|uniref:Protein kinase domain-containing protein n=1 Tax=Dissophora globulifera TaxID=979702 RepID=A0A9P6UMK3_9FUNG|nr:hypothetical protein BGZ99_010179 [Dissophora globulifera]
MTTIPDATFDPSTLQRLPQLSTGHLAPGAPTDRSLRSPLTPPPTPIISDNSGTPQDKLTVSARQLQNHVLQPEFLAEYVLGDELGSGGFGFVVSATRKSDNREVAVKFIFRDKVPVHGWANDPQLGVIPMEIHVLRKVQHANIIAFLNAYQDSKFFYLVMELHGTPWSASNPLLSKNNNNNNNNNNPTNISMIEAMANATLSQQRLAGASSTVSSVSSASYKTTSSSSSLTSLSHSGSESELYVEPPKPSLLVRRTSCDLFECIEHHSKFSESQARMIFKQIVECVEYLNSCGICHRDIKDENIVIDNDFKVKLIDFGSAVIIPRPQGKLFDRFYGTINYASPEILKGEKYRAESAEVWSLGILLYTILYGEVPFNDPVQAISGPYISPRVRSSSECLHLLNWMLAKSPERRATIEDVVSHPWLTGISMSGSA